MTKFVGKSALVVDDNTMNLKVAMRMLRKLSVEATCVESGIEALEVIDQGNFDVILLDIQMPDLDGYETACIIRNRGINIPIIAYTAHALGGDIEKCLAAGMDEHISKPMLLGQLEDKLLSVFTKQQL